LASAEEILRAFADPERLAIAGRLAQGPSTLGELEAGLGTKPARLRRHLNRLASVGVAEVMPDRRTWRLRDEALRQAAADAGPRREPGLALRAMDEEEERVLRQYFRAGQLREIPAKHSKRLIILERLALEFEPGVRYPEREVNRILRPFHDDHVTLRRYLVDEGFLSRERGEYWRSGGRVEL
jgi:hypothetical protein